VSTAAEETKNPQRNMPIGLIGSLAICTVFYMLVAAGVIGTVGAQPLLDAAIGKGHCARRQHRQQCAACAAAASRGLFEGGAGLDPARDRLAADRQPVGLAAGLALPSVVLMMMFGQTRIFFVMSRDGLLPARRSARCIRNIKTPHVVTIITGIVRRAVRRAVPGRRAGGHFQFGHAVRLRHGVDRGAGAASYRSGTDTPVPHAGGHDLSRRWRCWAAVYLFFSLSGYTLSLFAGWAVIGLIGLFPLQPQSQPCRARDHRRA
jgi:APA family basic amino acid/polyamine antiporter